MPIIDRAIAYVCNKYGVPESDVEDFASSVKLKLLENGYEILRKYKGGGFATFIGSTVRHLYLDQRIREWGKWRPSAEAQRLGRAAVELETLLFRDTRPLEQVVPIVAAHHQMATEEVRAMAGRLHPHYPRPRPVSLDDADDDTRPLEVADPHTFDPDYNDIAHQAGEIIRRFLEALSEQERAVLRLRFFAGRSVIEIATSMKLDKNALYRQINRRWDEVRALLSDSGISGVDLDELSARMTDDFAQSLRNNACGPSMDGSPGEEEGDQR